MIGGFRSICWFLYFCGQSVVAVIMIDSSKKRNSLVGVEVLSPYVIERRSKHRNLRISFNLMFYFHKTTSVILTEYG